MAWQDFFYFSKGERRALIALIVLISIAWGFIVWLDHKPPMANPDPTEPVDSLLVKAKPSINPTDSVVQLSPTSTPSTTPLQAERKPLKQRVQAYRYPSSRTSNKFPEGTVVELNGADSLTLQKVPGIGPAFARRIVRYRDLLGGYHHIEQLLEVYGITPERFADLRPWFRVDSSAIVRRDLNTLSFKEMLRHPYLDYEQTKCLSNLIRRQGRITSWDEVRLLDEFPAESIQKLDLYFTFEKTDSTSLTRK